MQESSNQLATPQGQPAQPAYSLEWSGETLASLLATSLKPAQIRKAILVLSEEEYLTSSPGTRDPLGLPDPKTLPPPGLGPLTALSITSPDYPPLLRALSAPPPVLFVLGSTTALAPGIAIVGSREMSPLGKAAALAAVKGAVQADAPVISGLALGVDAVAHRAALDAGLPTVAVLASSPLHPTPHTNSSLAKDILAANGALVSEQLPSVSSARPQALMARNRIIAALATVTVPCEASWASGTLGTVRDALALSRFLIVPRPGPASADLPGAQALLGLTDEDPDMSLVPAKIKSLHLTPPYASASPTTPAELASFISLAHRLAKP